WWADHGRAGRKWWWGFPFTVHYAFMTSIRPQIRLQPGALPLPRIHDDTPEYFQVNSPWGTELRSATLRPNKFPVDRQVFEPDALLFDPKYDDFPLGQELPVRRVTLLTPIPRLVGAGLGGAPGWQNRGRGAAAPRFRS